LREQSNQTQARQREPNKTGNRRLEIALNKGNNDINDTNANTASTSGGTGNGTNEVARGGARQQQTNGPQGSNVNSLTGVQTKKKKERTAEEEENDLKNRVYCLYAVQRSAQPVIAKAGMLTFSGPHGMSKNASR